MRRHTMIRTALRALLFVTIAVGVIGTTSCAWVKAGGTVVKGTGEGMNKAADQQEDGSFLGRLSAFGGKVFTSVGGAVESAVDDDVSKTAKRKGNSAGNSKASATKTTGDSSKTKERTAENGKSAQLATAESDPGSSKRQDVMVKLKYQSVDVRSSPQEGSAVIGKVKGGDKLAKTGETGDWVKIRLRDGTTGWLVSAFVEDFSRF